MQARALPRHGGFTVIELMVTLLVLAILSTAAVPSFGSFTTNQRIRAASTELLSDLTLARSESLKRATDVEIVPATGGWGQGWRVTVPGSAETLRERGPLGYQVEVYRAPGELRFNRNGRLDDPPAVVAFGLRATGEGDGLDVFTRCLYVDGGGRPHTEREACL